MNLIEEAVIVEFLGIKMYAFGAYVALGALFAFIVLCFSGHMLELKKGTVLLTYVCSAVCGVLVSRVVFCLLNRELGKMTPLSFWPQVDGGGWSMFGLIGGIFLGEGTDRQGDRLPEPGGAAADRGGAFRREPDRGL